MQVQDLMSRDLLTCGPNDSLMRAAQLMWDGDVGAIPVTDGAGQLVGIVTDRDICMAAYTKGCALRDCSVGAVMAREVHSCEPSDTPQLVEERMRRYQVRRLPVTQGKQLVGMLSLNDLARMAGKKKGRGVVVSLEDVGTTLARIGEQRRSESLAAQ